MKHNTIGKILVSLNAGETVFLSNGDLLLKYDKRNMDDFRVGHSGRQYVRHRNQWMNLEDFTVEFFPADEEDAVSNVRDACQRSGVTGDY
jgi:hypothetical protein